jgi:hypothetical protein
LRQQATSDKDPAKHPDDAGVDNRPAVERLAKGGVACTTPSSMTGQEEDRQALALAFIEVLVNLCPELNVIALLQTLSAVNRHGLTREYRQMFEDYRLTGIFDREILEKVAKVNNVRYLAQLKLGTFRQESTSRFGLLGLRVMETKTSTIRLFLQIWDSQDGSVAWEGVRSQPCLMNAATAAGQWATSQVATLPFNPLVQPVHARSAVAYRSCA